VAEHPVVAADRLEVRYRASSGDVLALDGLSFAVPAGQMVAVIGKSGAGKSTLLRCLTGFVKPTSGRLAVDGVEVAGAGGRALRRLRRRVAVVPQSYNLVERATALDNVLFGRLGHIAGWRSLLGLFPRSDVARASSALADLGLAERARQRVDSLSGGERQRVAIARALVQEPALVLADEPAASLDVSLTRLVLDTLAALNRERGVTILVNLHDLALARQYAGRILALRNGRLVFDGAPRELTPAAEQEIYDGAHPERGARPRARVRLVGAVASPA
jgi:phosphonate transport system ATP-binding protein